MITIMSALRFLVEAQARGRIDLGVGEALFRSGDRVARLYLVTAGEVLLERHTPSGVRLVLQRVRAGDVVAEPSVFAETYHCTASSASAVVAALASVETVRSAILSDPASLERLARRFASDVQAARLWAEVLSLRRLSDRLDAWLDLNGSALPARGRWLALAAELAVTPEALYRELARRRRRQADRLTLCVSE
jgi:CRP/FNR family transcriptional regulator, dissimilatory nitrate respiration regulator